MLMHRKCIGQKRAHIFAYANEVFGSVENINSYRLTTLSHIFDYFKCILNDIRIYLTHAQRTPCRQCCVSLNFRSMVVGVIDLGIVLLIIVCCHSICGSLFFFFG